MATSKRKQWIIKLGVGLAVVGAALLTAFILTRSPVAQANGEEKEDEEVCGPVDISVKTVHPRLDKNFQITGDRPANVEAYYRAEVKAKVAGQVQWIRVAPGSHVEKDQLLLRLEVPDLDADMKEKQDAIEQRTREWKAAKAKVEAAEGMVETAKANVKEKETLLTQAEATTELRKATYDRLRALRQRDAIEQEAVDEAYKNWKVAKATEQAAVAAKTKADAEVVDARANVHVAEAERDRTEQLIQVARSAYKFAQARDDFSRVKAPWGGTVVDRKVDPGDFVQNASTGNPTAVLAMERTDIVTVVMRVPDNYAPFVTPGTEAIIELDALPGVKIHGKVTRFAPSLETASHDKTMRVEVDLWNRDPSQYAAFLEANYDGNKPREGADVKDGPPPLVPEIKGKDPLGRSTHLMAGMYGKMTLVLKTFGDTYLIPSQAVLRQGGRTFIYLVEDGKAHLMPVEAQVDDGNLAKVERLGTQGEVLGDLTGKEEVIVSNLEELTEGQEVKTAPQEDWKALGKGSR
jgi:multidrug resistance efflux pump